MIAPLGYAIVAAGFLLAIWAGVQAARDRPTNDPIMVGVIVLEVALLVQTVLALLRLHGAAVTEPVTFIAYSGGILLPLGLGFQLARIERTKWGSIIVCFTAVVVAVMTLRLLQIWRT